VTSISGKVGEEIWRATLVAFGLSVTIEGLQVFSPVRTASLVDVTTNTLGALAGALMVPLLIVEVRRAKGRWSHLRPGLWLAAVIEAGHLVIVDRYFETNALVACAGLSTGWVVVRRPGFGPYGAGLAGSP